MAVSCTLSKVTAELISFRVSLVVEAVLFAVDVDFDAVLVELDFDAVVPDFDAG